MSIYRSVAIQEQMMQIYEQKLSRWPVPYESVYVNTLYGKTHMIVSGSKGKPPLLLLPGLAVTAAMWQPNIAAFCQNNLCYALDVIGDYGKSELDHMERYPRTGKDYSLWLRQVYERIGIEKAHLIGASNGGYVAINHAVHAPEQVEKLVLLAPSGLDITLKKILPKIFHYLLFPTDANRDALIHWFLGDNPGCHDAFYRQLWLGMQGLPKVPIPILISGNNLRKIRSPVMFIFGERDPTISAEKGVNRVKKHIPCAQIVVIPGVGHAMNYEAARQVENLVIAFLGMAV